MNTCLINNSERNKRTTSSLVVCFVLVTDPSFGQLDRRTDGQTGQY